jgi:hypothetical protein
MRMSSRRTRRRRCVELLGAINLLRRENGQLVKSRLLSRKPERETTSTKATERAGRGSGLYWTVGGMLAAIIGAVANAWVLLVEILR